MKSKNATSALLLALALALHACTLFFGSAHHDEARCVQRCRAMHWTVAAVAYHGDFASTCVCAPPPAATSGATTSAITPAQTSTATTGAAIAAAARPMWRNVPVLLP